MQLVSTTFFLIDVKRNFHLPKWLIKEKKIHTESYLLLGDKNAAGIVVFVFKFIFF